MVTKVEFHTCDFCGHQSEDVVEEDYYDPITKHDSTRQGCRDKVACLQRREDADREWRQALRRESLRGD